MTGEELRNADAAANNAVVGEGVKFERIRRITGYLVGTTDRFNDAKRAEESSIEKDCPACGRAASADHLYCGGRYLG